MYFIFVQYITQLVINVWMHSIVFSLDSNIYMPIWCVGCAA